MPIVMEIRLKRAVLRPWKRGDEKSLQTHANNKKVWLNMRDIFPHPYTAKDARAWIRYASKQRSASLFAITVDGNAVGGIGIHPGSDVYRKSAEIGYWLGEPYWGKGIATESVRAVSRHAFRKLGFRRLHASVFAWNPASRKVLEKAGFDLEGKLRKSVTKSGKIIDSFLYALTR